MADERQTRVADCLMGESLDGVDGPVADWEL
jgi:hypothetical protein